MSEKKRLFVRVGDDETDRGLGASSSGPPSPSAASSAAPSRHRAAWSDAERANARRRLQISEGRLEAKVTGDTAATLECDHCGLTPMPMPLEHPWGHREQWWILETGRYGEVRYARCGNCDSAWHHEWLKQRNTLIRQWRECTREHKITFGHKELVCARCRIVVRVDDFDWNRLYKGEPVGTVCPRKRVKEIAPCSSECVIL